ncbi:MAG: hypothetical protein F6K19_01380 [Cyanothece sp. SIO1E1]|nr:hypothetical protein [Cyanothece sp. SIO1E1]
MKSLALFENQEFGNIRVLHKNDETLWFVAKDVCDVLGTLTKHLPAILDEDERGVDTIDTPGGKQKMTIISESGFYGLVVKSRKPIAIPFRKWVTNEVLPSIRKTGYYSVAQEKKDTTPSHYFTILEGMIDKNTNSIDARGLYRFFEKGAKFPNWIKHRITRGSFVKGKHYETRYNNKIDGGQGKKVTIYMVSIYMAAQLSRAENSEKGRIALKFFENYSGSNNINFNGENVSHTGLSTNTEELIIKQTEVLISYKDKLDDIQSQLNELKQGDNDGYVTIKGYLAIKNVKSDMKGKKAYGRQASTYCKKNDIEIRKVEDGNYGHINSYPKYVLEEVISM